MVRSLNSRHIIYVGKDSKDKPSLDWPLSCILSVYDRILWDKEVTLICRSKTLTSLLAARNEILAAQSRAVRDQYKDRP